MRGDRIPLETPQPGWPRCRQCKRPRRWPARISVRHLRRQTQREVSFPPPLSNSRHFDWVRLYRTWINLPNRLRYECIGDHSSAGRRPAKATNIPLSATLVEHLDITNSNTRKDLERNVRSGIAQPCLALKWLTLVTTDLQRYSILSPW